MIRVLLIIVLSVFLFAQKIEILGEKSFSTKNILTVYDGIVIKKDLILSAQKIIYNPNTNYLFAKGNVYINFGTNYVLTNNIELNITNNNLIANPFFLFNFKDEDWINSTSSKVINNQYYAKKALTSTCNIDNPDWEISTTSLDYNKTNKWINLYNPRLYLKGIPILYLPYLGFSFDKTRSSGFLRPLFGYSANEGLLLTTPYYQVLGASADLEIDPTIRTRRGKGI